MQQVQYGFPSSGRATERSRSGLLPAVTGLLAVLALGAVMTIGTNGQSAREVSATRPAVQQGSSTKTPATAENRAAENHEWRELCSLSGGGFERSKVFKIKAKRVRLRYSIDGGISGVTVFLLREGTSSDSGAPPKIMADGPISATKTLKVKPGRYYLEVVGANGDWQVGVAEKR